MGLALYICLAGLALGMERVELKIKIMFGRLSSVDRAAKEFCSAGLSIAAPMVAGPN